MSVLDAAIRECARLPRPLVISFSGGRTSGVMLWSFLQAYGGTLPNGIRVIFTNTGKERSETLDFVQECSTRWSVPITWLEYRPGAEQWEIVNHNSASRNGEPFAAMIENRQMLPNPLKRICTEHLKIKVKIRYCRDELGWKRWSNAIGFRWDEPERLMTIRGCKRTRGRETLHAPLGSAGLTAPDVAAFWRDQDFDLRLPMTASGKTLGGNCDACILKGDRALVATFRADPRLADWWIEQEERLIGRKRPGRQRFRLDRSSYRELRDFALDQGDLFDASPDLTQLDCHCMTD